MSRPRRRMGVSASFLVLVLTLFDLSGCGGLVAPTLDLGIQVGPNGAELSWIEHNGEKARVRYDVQRSTSEIGPWTSLIPDPLTRTDETRFIDATAPSNDGNFWYRVEADYRTIKKPYTPTLRYSQPLSVTLSPTCTTYCGPDPLPTLDALAQVANNTVDMDWSDTALPLAAPYSVERAPSASGPWTALVAPADRNSTMRFTDAQTPANDQTYFYRVVADHFRASAPANITLDPACTGYCVGYDLDRDGDGVLDWNDNCVAASNALQSDDDLDGVGNACDAPANFDEALALDPDPVDQTALATEIQLLLDANADDPAKDHLLLYLTQGRYYVDNSGGPIVLSHNKPLYIYGAGREQVEIRGISNAHPIFQIENPTGSAQHVLLSGFVLMREDGDASTIESMVGVRSVNSDQMHIDLASMTFDKVSLEVKGAGFVRVQGTALTPRQWSEQAVLVDHPDADVFIINGGFGNGGDPPDDDLDPTQISNARQKRGRLRTYTAAAASARGQGDVWLETTSKYGAHVIADQRSEGGNAKGYECGDDDPFNPGEKLSFTSQFLYVPATTERVDVVVKGALASWRSVRVDANEPVRTAHCTAVSGEWTMAEYSSPGRLWMLGNNGYSGADHVVKGYAPGAHILTAGNVVRHPTHGPIDVTGTGSLVSIGDMGTFNRWCADLYSDGELNDPPCASPTGNPLYPSYRFMARDENGTLTFDTAREAAVPVEPMDLNLIPETFETRSQPVVAVPKARIPKPLDRPVMNQALPGMIDITNLDELDCLPNLSDPWICDFPVPQSAIANDDVSDWQAIQFAFSHSVRFGENGSLVYFPAGDYCIDQTLYWNHQASTRTGIPYGSYDHGVYPTGFNDDKDTVWFGGQGGTWAGAGSGLTTLRYDTDCDGTADPGNLFRTNRMTRQLVQGITFEAAPHGTSETFWVESYHQRCNPTTSGTSFSCDTIATNASPNDDYKLDYAAAQPFNWSPTQANHYFDVEFIGGDIAYAGGLDFGAQNSENLWVHSAFRDANTGVYMNAPNNLNNTFYEAVFDQTNLAAGGIDITFIGASVLGGGDCIKLGSGPLYLYDLDDDSGCEKLVTSTSYSINAGAQVIIEDSEALTPSATQYNLGLNGSFILLHSHLETPIDLNFGSSAAQASTSTSAALLGLHSTVGSPPLAIDLFAPDHEPLFAPGTGDYNPFGPQMRSNLE